MPYSADAPKVDSAPAPRAHPPSPYCDFGGRGHILDRWFLADPHISFAMSIMTVAAAIGSAVIIAGRVPKNICFVAPHGKDAPQQEL